MELSKIRDSSNQDFLKLSSCLVLAFTSKRSTLKVTPSKNPFLIKDAHCELQWLHFRLSMKID